MVLIFHSQLTMHSYKWFTNYGIFVKIEVMFIPLYVDTFLNVKLFSFSTKKGGISNRTNM